MPNPRPVSPRVATRFERTWRRGFWPFAALVLGLLTLLALPGFWANFRHALAPDLGDPLLNLVFLEWGAHQIGLGLPDLWNANYFHPAAMTLALSDHLVGPALLHFVLRGLGSAPATSYNVLFFGSFVGTGLATLWLARRAGLSRPAALFAACAYTFSSFRWMHVNHLQILWAPFLPLTLGAFDRLLERTDAKRAVAFLLAYAAHLTGGTYLAYMIHFPLAAIAVRRARSLVPTLRSARRALVLASCCALCLAAAWLAFSPYERAARVHGMHRFEGSLREWGAALASFVTPDGKTPLAVLLPAAWRREENALFVGVTVAALLLALGARTVRATALPRGAWRRAALALGIALVLAAFALGDLRTWTGADRFELGALSLSLHRYARPWRGLLIGLLLIGIARWRTNASPNRRSPASGLRASIAAGSFLALLLCFPLVYVPLARKIPGLDGMRVPARFFAFASLGLCLAAAAQLDLLRRRLPLRSRRFVAPLLIGLFAFESLPRSAAWSRLDAPGAFPRIYARIASLEEVRVLAELPLPDWRRCHEDTLRMYYATAHWKPIVNGCSGHFPRSYERLRDALSHPPTDQNLASLRDLGVTHLLFREARQDHQSRVRNRMRPWSRQAAARGEGEVVYEDGESLLFALGADRAAP